jgi:hypothetical protein
MLTLRGVVHVFDICAAGLILFLATRELKVVVLDDGGKFWEYASLETVRQTSSSLPCI